MTDEATNAHITKYQDRLNKFYKDGTSNHLEHNENLDYWRILLKDLLYSSDVWKGKVFLDYGCGKGRNMLNALILAEWDRMVGVDISMKNIEFCRRTYFQETEMEWLKNDGSLIDLDDSSVDFAMSTVVLQHLCSHSLRLKIKKEIYRVLKKGGVFCFQMGFGGNESAHHDYYDDFASKYSNSEADTRVDDPSQLITDLESIGFSYGTFEVRRSYLDDQHPYWIYVRCQK